MARGKFYDRSPREGDRTFDQYISLPWKTDIITGVDYQTILTN